MTRPVRLQLSRKRGFNLQELSLATNGRPAVNVARPFRDGNEFHVGVHGNAAECVALHRAKITKECAADPQAAELMWKRLRGCNIACWCRLDAPCHGNTLLELANP